MFEKLKDIVEFGYKITTLGNLTISPPEMPLGEDEDLKITKIGKKMAIPGSSIKGLVRSNLESKLSELGKEVCVPSVTLPRNKKERESYLKRINRRNPDDCMKEPCPICLIFGNTYRGGALSGRAIFLDAFSDSDINDYTLVRTHVAIERSRRVQSSKKLVELSAVEGGVEFKGTIRIINPENWMVGALRRALETAEFTGIGGKKSAGYGQVSIEIKNPVIFKFGSKGWKPEERDWDDYIKSFNDKFGISS